MTGDADEASGTRHMGHDVTKKVVFGTLDVNHLRLTHGQSKETTENPTRLHLKERRSYCCITKASTELQNSLNYFASFPAKPDNCWQSFPFKIDNSSRK